MNHGILLENQKKRLDQPLWMLICFAMFNFWQMGFIYFVGPTLTIDGKTPLPIDMDNATALIALCYVLSILWMIFLPQTVIWTQRIATGIALLTAVGLFLPMTDDSLRHLIYVQIFCCCLMIGFETFIMVNYFSEHSNIRHLTAAYGIALFLIAVVQNDFIPITFPTFRVVEVAALTLLLVFFLRMPAGRKALPRYVKKSDGIPAPKRLLFGTYILVFTASLMAVSGPAVSGEAQHGVFITYFVDALASLAVYALYKKKGLHPFRLIPLCIGFGCLGFLLMLAASYGPALSYLACGCIGISLLPCQMLPLYGAVIMTSYPSRYISSIIIALALAAVLVQSSLVELFRSTQTMLYLTYGIIMVILVILYLQIEPFFLFTLRKRIPDEDLLAEGSRDEASPRTGDAPPEEALQDDPLAVLSKREREVVELICLGYSNPDIARMLFISEHTVKDHTKKIYPKMGVHSRFELAALVSRQRTGEPKTH